MIKVNKLKKYYGEKLILDIPNFIFEKGKIYSVVGKNGAGKSTFIKILSGIVSLDEGKLEIERENIILSPQEPMFFKGDVWYNLTEPFKLCKKKISTDKLEELLKKFEIDSLKKSSINSLSGGEKAKVQFIRTILYDKDCIFLDEPTASIDKKSSFLVEEILLELKGMGKLIVIITHDHDQARRVSDVILEIDEAKLLKRGT
ncbi:ABC transporter ATP-binding protein [Cetobacterium sp.]|uniref:ABC transporter ATP-binding protein n=1 Tax=Cetobacterium sp. TaxID=2071632 RepID=UPI002FCC8877